MPARTPEEVRARMKTLCARFAGERVDLRVEDLDRARLYGEGEGVLVWFHGGRMVSGDLETHDALCRRLARASGWRVLAVDYRLAPEHRFPAQLEDAAAGLEMGFELSEQVALGGDSAGASLAITAALRSGRALDALVLIYPMVDGTMEQASVKEFWNGSGTSGHDIELGYEWWLPEGFDRRDSRVSPIFAEGFGSLPRTFVLTAGVDPLRDEGAALAARLRAFGVRVAEEQYADHLHGFMTYPARFQAAERAAREVAAFLSAAGA